jgi:hypothetical protein
MTPSRPSAIIVDIDGTVATHELPDGRLIRPHHEYRLVSWDLPNQPVIDTVRALRNAGFEIVFCSGRPVIDAWLFEHVGEWAARAPLFMRGQGDGRPDDIDKTEIYETFIRGHYDVRLALDDRPRVIRAWQALGVPVFDVAPGSGEF